MLKSGQRSRDSLGVHGYRHAMGAALIFSGLPLAWYSRVWFGKEDDRVFSIVLVAIALLLVTHWGRLIRGRFSVSPFVALLPFLFVWPAMLMAWFFGRSDDISALYLAFVSAFFLALLTSPRHAFLMMPIAFFDIALIVALLSLGQFVFFGPVLLLSEDADFGSRLFAGDSKNPNYLAFVAGLGLVAAFSKRKDWSGSGIVRWWLWVTGIPLLVVVWLLSGTRSVLLGFGLCLSSVVLQHVIAPRRIRAAASLLDGNLPKTKRVWGLLSIWVPMAALISALIGNALVASTEGLVSGTVAGFDVYVAGGLREVDESAEARTMLRERAFSEFNMWGQGYDALYVDAPVLQAFFDLGLLGGLAFVLVTLVLPFGWWILKVRSSGISVEQRFPFLVYLFFLPNLILHGRPYDFSVWLPVMLLFCVIARRDIDLKPALLR